MNLTVPSRILQICSSYVYFPPNIRKCSATLLGNLPSFLSYFSPLIKFLLLVWVPFCKKFAIEPRAPKFYFCQKKDYLKDKTEPSFVKERRAMKREYEEFKVRINALVAKSQKVPKEGWTMQDGTPWLGNNVRDHPGMIQVFLGQI